MIRKKCFYKSNAKILLLLERTEENVHGGVFNEMKKDRFPATHTQNIKQ
jgi:hypothetical protein